MVMVSNLPDSSLPLSQTEDKFIVAQNNVLTKTDLSTLSSAVAAVIDPSVIDHNLLLNYNPLEHIDWTNATNNLLTTGTIQGSNFSGSSSGINTGDQALFETFKVLGELPATDIVADNPNDCFTFVPGPNVNITSNPTTKELLISVDTGPGFGIAPIGIGFDSFVPDGLQDTFPLSTVPTNKNQTLCFFDGTFQGVVNYDIVGTDVVFVVPPPNYVSKIDFYTYADDDLVLTRQEQLEGVDFNTGDPTITLGSAPQDLNHLLLFFDGIFVGVPNYTVAGTLVTFTDPIPVGVKKIETIIFEDTGSNPVDVDLSRQVYLAGVNFTAGLTDILVMPSAVDDTQDALIFIDGAFLGQNNYSITNAVVTFNDPIPVFTNKVEILSLTGEYVFPSAIPSFGIIAVSGSPNVEADISFDTVNFVAGTDMTITTDGVDVVTFDYSGGAENNTASNVGGFNEVFKQKLGVDFEFRTLQSTTPALSITQNADDLQLILDETQLDHDNLLNFVANEHIDWTNATQDLVTTGTITGSNLSGTNTGDQNLFATVTGDAGSTTADILADTINIVGGTNTTTTIVGDTLTIDGTGAPDQNLFETVTGDVGSTTADTVTDTLTIAGGTNVTTTVVGDTITIDASAAGEANTASNQGGFFEGFIQKTGVDLEFRTFQSTDSSIGIVQNAQDLDLTVNEANVDHDALQNFVANEHIDWTSATQNISTTGTITGSNLSGTNTGDQNLWATVTSDAGSATADILADTLTIAGGTNITTAIVGDTLTINASTSGDPDQNLWETFTADAGATTADTTTDNLTVAGGTNITTAIAGDTLTINSTGTPDQNLFETFTSDSGSTTADTTTDTLTVAGGTNVNTAVVGDTLTINVPVIGDPDQNLFETVTGDVGSTTADTVTDTLTILGGTGATTTIVGDTLTIDTTGEPDQNLWETIAADAGGPVSADTTTDTLTIAGGTNVNTAIAGDTVTINVPTIGDPDQNLFETFTADAGSTTADTVTDTLTVAGGTGITTSIAGDTLTINSSGEPDQNLWETITGDVGSTTADTVTDNLTIAGGTNVTTTVVGDTITIDAAAAGEANTASNQGGFVEPFIQKTGVDLEFRTIQSSDSSVTVTQNATNIDLTLPAITGTLVTFTSTDEIITSGGQLVLAHGLSSTPIFMEAQLVCQIAQFGYSIGDVVNIPYYTGRVNEDQGLSIRADATNLTIRYGLNSNALMVIDATTGDGRSITNANWLFRITASIVN